MEHASSGKIRARQRGVDIHRPVSPGRTDIKQADIQLQRRRSNLQLRPRKEGAHDPAYRPVYRQVFTARPATEGCICSLLWALSFQQKRRPCLLQEDDGSTARSRAGVSRLADILRRARQRSSGALSYMRQASFNNPADLSPQRFRALRASTPFAGSL